MEFDQECNAEEGVNGEQLLEVEVAVQNLGVEALEISLHAIASSLSPRIMRVMGMVKGQLVLILVEIGSPP